MLPNRVLPKFFNKPVLFRNISCGGGKHALTLNAIVIQGRTLMFATATFFPGDAAAHWLGSIRLKLFTLIHATCIDFRLQLDGLGNLLLKATGKCHPIVPLKLVPVTQQCGIFYRLGAWLGVTSSVLCLLNVFVILK